MTQLFLGADPGASGAIVAIDGRNIVKVIRLDGTERDIADQLESIAKDVAFCWLEAVNAFPGQGVTSMFSFGQSYGTVRGMLTAFHIPFQAYRPRDWQKVLGITPRVKPPKNPKLPGMHPPEESKTEFKNRLRARAQELFPTAKITLRDSDALLLAEACRRVEVRHRGDVAAL